MSGNAKGKNRARSMSETERTPLLRASTSLHVPRSSLDDYNDAPLIANPSRPPRQRSTLSQLWSWLAVFMLSAFFVLLIFLAFLWVTLKSAPAVRQAPESILSHAMRWRTTSVEVESVSGGRISLSVSGEFGVDTDWVLGIEPWDNSAMAFARRAAGRWLTSTLGGIRSTSTTSITIHDGEGVTLLNCTASKLDLPVRGTLSTGKVGMAPVKIPVQLSPSSDAGDLIRFANSAWTTGVAHISVAVPKITLVALRRAFWLPEVKRSARDISQNLFITCRFFSLGGYVRID